MNLRTKEEWLQWGDDPRNFIGFFSPIEQVNEENGFVRVKCKYGEYRANLETQDVETLSGVDWYILSEVAKYGMGYKWWDKGDKDE